MSNRPALRDLRLEIMAAVVDWEGEIGNARVRDLFGLQVVQASRLLADFKEVMGGRVVESGRSRVLVPVHKGVRLSSLSFDDYVRAALRQVSGALPDWLIDARDDQACITPAVFACVRQAILFQRGIDVVYASMTSSPPSRRTLFPHAVVRAGRRWHVRAWCASRGEFRDFVLGRFLSAEISSCDVPAESMADGDLLWNTFVSIRLAPHRSLALPAQSVIAMEFLGGNHEQSLSARACLVMYVIQDLRAAVRPLVEVPPEFQLEVVNVVELRPWLFSKGNISQ